MMIKYTLYTLILTAMFFTSCVDRKTSDADEKQNGQKVVRLEDKSTGKIPDSDTRNPKMNAEQEKEIAEAKGIINDYYNSFERKSPREAYDMWAPKKTPSDYQQFTKDNPNYDDIEVAFADGSTAQKMGQNYQVTIPIRVSATTKDGDIMNSSGKVTLIKKGSEDNPKYEITSMDLKKEDS